MTSTEIREVRLPDDRPPDWVNSLMKWMLATPGLQAVVGQGVGLLSFDGRRTGKHYEIPVSYQRDGDLVTIITKRNRRWWHNFETPIEVGLRLAGKDYSAKAESANDDEGIVDFMVDFMRKRPMDAEAYGLGKEVTREKVEALLPQVVVIRAFIS